MEELSSGNDDGMGWGEREAAALLVVVKASPLVVRRCYLSVSWFLS